MFSRPVGLFLYHNSSNTLAKICATEWSLVTSKHAKGGDMLWHHFAFRLGLALILGALIGVERQWRQRMAGLRTNALVAAGASMFLMMGGLIAGDGSQGRVAAYVVSGIGFLGGGVILKDGLSIRGLNSAATLWCTAAIGALAGLGYVLFPVSGTFAVLGANTLLRPLAKAMDRTKDLTDAEILYLVRITCRATDDKHIRSRLLEAAKTEALLLRSVESEDLEIDGRVRVQATLMSTGHQDSLLERVVSQLGIEPGVSAASWQIVAEHE
jgi:putative Mg2+ transporter-C (MgtC) family protein